MSGENTLDYRFYTLEKTWLKQVESLLIEQIPFIKGLINRTEKQGTQEYCDGNYKAEILDSALIITTQNFRFIISDNESEFSINYRIIDKNTRENAIGMWGVGHKGQLLCIPKAIGFNPQFYVKWGNYPIFEVFIRDIEGLDLVLTENMCQ